MERNTLPRRKYPAPKVRQTVASMIRMVRANPLILEHNTGTTDCTAEEFRQKLPTSIIEDPFGIHSKSRTSFLKNIKETSVYDRPSFATIQTKVVSRKNDELPHTKPKAAEHGNIFRKPMPPKKQNPPNKPTLKRKSLSADDIPAITVLGPMNCTATQSMESLSTISPINKFRSLNQTVNRSSVKIRNSTPINSKTPSLNELRARLNIWLQKRNKLPTNFQFLKNMKEQKGVREMQKVLENFETVASPDDKENAAAALNTPALNRDFDDLSHTDVLNETLNELKILIEQKYDHGHCQYWLKKIKERFANVEEMPQFWECRAALEQAGDNVNEAIECYKAAIIHGAEIQGIDESLKKLFQKFGSLHLGDSMNYTPNTKSKVKNSNIIYNQFKSSIIQFAVLQKKVKSDMQAHKMTAVVTPVRRSSRLSHVKTPNQRVFPSIKELGEDNQLNFRMNRHLSVRYD